MHRDALDARLRPRLLTTKDVQSLIKVDRSTVYRMAESGRLPAVKVGRQWRFPEDRLREWLERGRVDGDPADPELCDLIAPEPLRALAELVGDLLGVMILFTDMAGRPLAEPGHPCELFSAAHPYPGVLDHCVEEWRQMAGNPDLDPRWLPSPLGFLCARALVRVGDHLRGMVLAAGVAPPTWPLEPPEWEDLAAGLGVPAGVLEAHAGGVYRLSPPEQERVLRSLPRVAAFLSRLAAGDRFIGGPSDGAADSSAAHTPRSIQ